MNFAIFTVVPTWVLVHLRPKEEFLRPSWIVTSQMSNTKDPTSTANCLYQVGSGNQRWPWVNRHAGHESCIWTAEVAKTHPCTLAYFEVLFNPSPPNLELAYMKKRRRKNTIWCTLELSVKPCSLGPVLHPSFDAASPLGCCPQSNRLFSYLPTWPNVDMAKCQLMRLMTLKGLFEVSWWTSGLSDNCNLHCPPSWQLQTSKGYLK